MTMVEERVSRLEGAYDHLATKADIADARTEIADARTEIANVRTEMAEVRTDIAEVRTDIAEVRTEMAAVENRLLFRLGGLILGSSAALGTALGILTALGG